MTDCDHTSGEMSEHWGRPPIHPSLSLQFYCMPSIFSSILNIVPLHIPTRFHDYRREGWGANRCASRTGASASEHWGRDSNVVEGLGLPAQAVTRRAVRGMHDSRSESLNVT